MHPGPVSVVHFTCALRRKAVMPRTPVTLLALAAVVALLAACASAPPQVVAQAGTAAAPAPATEQVCRKELPTGMRIPITVCRNVAAVEERSRDDRDWAERIPTEVPDVGR
jgi:hypothetical protein